MTLFNFFFFVISSSQNIKILIELFLYRVCFSVSIFRYRRGVQASVLRSGAKRSELRGHEEGGVCGAAETLHSQPLVLRSCEYKHAAEKQT